MSDISTALDELRQLSNEVYLTGGRGLSCDKEKEKDHSWLKELQSQLGNVTSSLQEVDTHTERFNAHTNSGLMIGHLDTDPSLDSFSLYSDLVTSHKWLDKVKDYAFGSAAYLGQNSLKRSYCNIAKSRRKPQSTCHVAQPKVLEEMIANANNMFKGMMVTYTQPGGSNLNAVVEVRLDKILKAVLIFKGLMIEWVVVKGWKEDLVKPDGQVDIWGESRFHVFQRITENANAAMLNFQSPVYPHLAVKSFMTYLHSFKTIFSDKCKQCGNHLQNNLPPTWREYRTLEPFHEDCRI